jgi:hypothetical protein
VTPICLPKSSEPYLKDGAVTVAGWGPAGYEGFLIILLCLFFFLFFDV